MKYTIKEFANKFNALLGDQMATEPEQFIIDALNWAFNSLPSVPKLDRAFSKHEEVEIGVGDYKFDLNGDFRRITEVPMLNFYSSTGGEPCSLPLCPRDNIAFYNKNGLVSMKKQGVPCEYTIEQEADHTYLVLDRPTSVPIIIDYIYYGYPKPVSSMDDTIELSAVIENLILATMRHVAYEEAVDFNLSGSVMDILDNKYIPEAIQMLNKTFKSGAPIIMGEV